MPHRPPDDPPGVPLDEVGRLGLQFSVDTNFVGDDQPGSVELRRLRSEGWVRLLRTDVVQTELEGATDLIKRMRLLTLAGDYVEQLGPAVWGHSRWGSAVWAGAEDEERLDKAFSVMFPGSDRSQANSNNLRDAMHVATAVRYGMNGLVTRNDRGLLRKSAEIADAFDGFVVATPEQVVEIVERFKARWLARHEQLAEGPSAPLTVGSGSIGEDSGSE